MKVSFQRTGAQLSSDSVASLERGLGVELPTDYRQFLLHYNGGQPIPDCVGVAGLAGGATDVQIFFGIRRSVETSNLAWNIEQFEQLSREGLLPIACDSGGGLFCLSLSGPTRGRVYFVDPFDEACATARSFVVADSFDGMLAALFDNPTSR
ncbi:MAG: SMI1/KNR4 family protein [Phycisphaerales bacterium]|nr:SMI1/KNR4 family protein [Phycisphaerales bacterium]